MFACIASRFHASKGPIQKGQFVLRATPHPQQDQRLRTLYNYEILDTPREEEFDEIVELAAEICDAPISVINLIDKDRQWFKAEVGLGARETPLETSLCSHAILEEPFVEIPDTLKDPRMADNPRCASSTPNPAG